MVLKDAHLDGVIKVDRSLNDLLRINRTCLGEQKFDIRLTEKRNGWCAEITRQQCLAAQQYLSVKLVSETEALAQEWAEKELASFIANQVERNDRKSSNVKSVMKFVKH